jgi:hypothetical protein
MSETQNTEFDFTIEPSQANRIEIVETLDSDLVGAMAARCN